MFEKDAFIPFLTAGHPDLEATREIVIGLAEVGAALVEIGLPFSDPIADGPVIQRSSFEALRHGYSMEDYLQMVREVRSRSDVPLIFMTYLNPVIRYGVGRLDSEGAQAGLDGLLISDLIPEELGSPVVPPLERLKSVFLVAPTSSDRRIQSICEATTGFVYAVARTGVTGRHTEIGESLPRLVERVRRHTRLPVAVGFGLRTKSDVRRVWSFAEGAVVGSAIVSYVEEHRTCRDLSARVKEFVRRVLLPG